MNITPEQFLTKLAASPADARAFDACAPRGMSRRQHVEFTLAQVKNSCTNVAESKTLADARAANARLKAEVANARARLATAQIQASNSMKPKPPAAPAPTHTAASFSAPKITMARAEFDKLSATDAYSFLAQKGKILA
jgi:hypothetical protein